MYYIVSQIENIFPNSIKKDWGKYNMPTNEGHYFPITFDLKDMSRAMVFMSRLEQKHWYR